MYRNAVFYASDKESRRRAIERGILGPQSMLRRGSLPKWINPKTDIDEQLPEGRGYTSSGSEIDYDSDEPKLTQGTSDRAPVLRRNNYYRVKTFNDVVPPKSPSQDKTEVRLVENQAMVENPEDLSLNSICETCQGINAESMSTGEGYDHLLVYELDESKSTCDMCRFIDGEVGHKMRRHTGDRYRYRLSFTPDDTVSEKSTYGHQSMSGSANDRDFSWALISAMDLRPWEPPEDYKVRYRYDESDHPEDYVKPYGSSPMLVRSRSVNCFTEEHDPAEKLGMRWVREIGASTKSTKSFEIANGWLKGCLSSEEDGTAGRRSLPHSHGTSVVTRRETDMGERTLRETFPRAYPARLIQIDETALGDLVIHLINTENRDYQYAAVSYCWGQQAPEERKWQLTEGTHASHHETIDFTKLPPTVRDSISIAWKLGITYIWIDALCIIQDSALDWARESAKMGGIYLGSHLTIAVSASKIVDSGCFNSNSQRTTELKTFITLVTIDSKHQDGQNSRLYFLHQVASIPDMYEDEVIKSPLSSRAWTYQESVLPRRILYFTSKQLFWECTHCRLSEDNFPQIQADRPYPILDFNWSLSDDVLASFWYIGAVEQYSQRHMTFEKDKLVAISALARATHYNRPSDYIGGLWRESLLLGLTWCRSNTGHKSKTFPCPSWSWASQVSAVSYSFAGSVFEDRQHRSWTRHLGGDREEEDKTPKGPISEIIDVKWTSDPTNPFGNVSDAYIELRTLVGTGTIFRDHFNKPGMKTPREKFSQGLMIPYTTEAGKAEYRQFKATMDDSNAPGGKFTLALLKEPTFSAFAALVLEPVDEDGGTFRRIGLAERYDGVYQIYTEGIEFLEDWEERTIRLV